jgi:hypothetical protein
VSSRLCEFRLRLVCGRRSRRGDSERWRFEGGDD